MADPNDTAGNKIDLTPFEFGHSGCSWCHPGGGPFEYDREGYRFDGAAGLFNPAGTNPGPNSADYYIFGTQAGADASSYAGAGYFAATSTTGVFSPDQVLNPGTLKKVWDPSSSTYKTVGKKFNTWSAGGVAEADCFMCHYTNQYANEERNFAFPGATSPKLAASLGLVGAGIGQTGLLAIATKGQPNTNPNPAPTAWTGWSTEINNLGNYIQTTPRKENCTLCHFPDKSMAPSAGQTCGTMPEKCGPSSKPLGFTAFQKYMAAGTTFDGDELPGVNGKDGNNDVAWNAVKGRVEAGKRGESINDNNNPDAHIKWPSYSGSGPSMGCVDCHYLLAGNFSALEDASLNIIQPAVSVQAIDHQFAKGNNAPDGKNMDPLDNTATCEGCHDGSYAGAPVPAHAGFLQLHIDVIHCKTCHIPVLNAPMKQVTADFLVGPYQTFERTQTTEISTGVGYKPLYMWRAQEHDGTSIKIQPITTMAVPVWANYVSGSYSPTYQRLGKKSAEDYRASIGDVDANGVYDWRLNDTQGGDKALIVNTQAEITGMVTYLASNMTANGVSNPTPVMSFYFNQFAVSHNVAPISRDGEGNPVPGSLVQYKNAGGTVLWERNSGPLGINGCTDCHSSTSPIGFFTKSHTLFNQPSEGGAGLVQTEIDGVKRVNVKFTAKDRNGANLPTFDLSGSHGATVGNTLDQGEVLGYTSAQLAGLTDLNNCAACHTTINNTNHHDGTCTSCHTTQHTAPQYNTTNASCTACHLDTADHHADAAVTAACTSCHTEPGVTVPASTNANCLACHSAGIGTAGAIDTATNHHGSTQNCTVCHTAEPFTPLPFTTDAACEVCHTGKTLSMAMPSVTCANCHTNPGVAPTTAACLVCHTSPATNGGGVVLTSTQAGQYADNIHSSTPIARFSWSNDTTTSLKINFNAAGTTCPTGYTCTYSWNFGDTCSSNGGTTGIATYCVYADTDPASKSVTLTVSANNGQSDDETSSVTPVAVNAAPTCGTNGVTYGTDRKDVTFTQSGAGSLDGSDVLYINWGDGSPLQAVSPNSGTLHHYALARQYTLKYMVKDSGGLSCKGSVVVDTRASACTVTVDTDQAAAGDQPLQGATVYVKTLGGATRCFGLTGADGSKVCSGLAPASYKVYIYKTGKTFDGDGAGTDNMPVTVTCSGTPSTASATFIYTP